MKIRCEYCDSMFDDTLEKCPNCYAPNPNVRRSTPDQPTTIEGLKEWYESKGLPPYETTRFFIGIDYKKPRAFGIYKDENTGNFIVYKNKDNGQRAVRYEGTDEAYAVNELFMRLKQEILEQKSHSISKSSGQSNQYTSRDAQKYYDSYNSRRSGNGSNHSGNKIFKRIIKIVIIYFAIQTIAPLLSLGVFSSAFRDEFKNRNIPQRGYYSYGGNTYFTFGKTSTASDAERWSIYNKDTGDWELTNVSSIPVFEKNKDASPYFLSEQYSSDYDFPSFGNSRLYYDITYDGYVSKGYYNYDDKSYYHLESDDSNSWYVYSEDKEDWASISSSEVPDALTNQYDAKDFYYVPNWNSETQISDFEDTEYYATYERDKAYESSYSSSDSWSSNDSSDYSWDSGSDSWDSGSTDWGSDW